MAETSTCSQPNLVVDLPLELLLVLLDYLPISDLHQVCLTCRLLRDVCQHLTVWRTLGRTFVNFGDRSGGSLITDNSKFQSPVQEQCRVAYNWSNGYCKEHLCMRFRAHLLPWLRLSDNHLYVSVTHYITRQELKTGRKAHSFQRGRQGVKYEGHSKDVCRFVVKPNAVVSCGRDGRVMMWDESSARLLRSINTDLSHVKSVDATREVIVGGTDHQGVQVWGVCDGRQVHRVPLVDRVWSVQIDPSQRIFATGTSGLLNFKSLKLWDIETAQLINVCGDNKRQGEGILDMHFESRNTLLTCGYDTVVRQWDVRTPSMPVLELDDPSDNTVYCLSSDNHHFIASGCCRHGVVRFWDKRKGDRCIQSFYMSGRSSRSPVYSLQFNQRCLYAALSNGVYALDFSTYKTWP